MRTAIKVLFVAVGVAFAGGTAQAQEASPSSCHQQIKQLCPGLKLGDGALKDCVNAHESQLTADCQQHVEKMKARFEAFKTACAADLKADCSDITPGKGREVFCLLAHEPTLSQPCAAAVSEGKAMWRHHHHGHHGHWKMRACKADAESLCANVEPGEGRIMACLRANQAKVSPACQQVLGSENQQ